MGHVREKMLRRFRLVLKDIGKRFKGVWSWFRLSTAWKQGQYPFIYVGMEELKHRMEELSFIWEKNNKLSNKDIWSILWFSRCCFCIFGHDYSFALFLCLLSQPFLILVFYRSICGHQENTMFCILVMGQLPANSS